MSLRIEIGRVEREGLDYWSGVDTHGHPESGWVKDDRVSPTASDVLFVAMAEPDLILRVRGDTDTETALNLYRVVAERQYDARVAQHESDQDIDADGYTDTPEYAD